MGSCAFKHTDLPWRFLSMVYYSVVTFTTLGFGDISPKTIPAAMWVMAEVIIGYVMLGGLISIFANKLARHATLDVVGHSVLFFIDCERAEVSVVPIIHVDGIRRNPLRRVGSSHRLN